MIKLTTIGVVILLICLCKTQEVTFYVDITSTYTATDCGSSLTTACVNLSNLPLFSSGFVTSYKSFIVVMALGTYPFPITPLNLYGLNISVQSASVSEFVILDGSKNSTLFTVLEDPLTNVSMPTIISLNGLTIQNSYSNNSNGGVLNIVFNLNSTLDLKIAYCKFINNILSLNTVMDNSGSGSVIYFETGENCTVKSSLSIDASLFTNGEALNSLIFINSSLVATSIFSSQFTNNYARLASVLYTESSILISESTFRNNSARVEGGSIYIYRSSSSSNFIQSTNFFDNAAGNGGAISMYDSYLYLVDCSFTNNMALVKGGSIYVYGDESNIYIDISKFTNGVAGSGGALVMETNIIFLIENTIFQNNSAVKGGSIYLYYAVGNLNHSPISLSNANQGGAIYSGTSKFNIFGGQLIYNTADYGASIYCSASKINITQTLITNNTDTMDISSEEGGKVIPNNDNIYCSLSPSYTFCVFSGDLKYTEYCGEQIIIEKTNLSKGQVAGIVIGSVLGAALIAFGCAFFLTSKFSIKSYFSALKENISHEDIESDDDEKHYVN